LICTAQHHRNPNVLHEDVLQKQEHLKLAIKTVETGGWIT